MSHGGTTFKWGLMCGSFYICLVFALLILEQKGVCVLAPFPKFILLWTRVIQTAFSHLALILDKHFQYARHLTMLEEDSSRRGSRGGARRARAPPPPPKKKKKRGEGKGKKRKRKGESERET